MPVKAAEFPTQREPGKAEGLLALIVWDRLRVEEYYGMLVRSDSRSGSAIFRRVNNQMSNYISKLSNKMSLQAKINWVSSLTLDSVT